MIINFLNSLDMGKDFEIVENKKDKLINNYKLDNEFVMDFEKDLIKFVNDYFVKNNSTISIVEIQFIIRELNERDIKIPKIIKKSIISILNQNKIEKYDNIIINDIIHKFNNFYDNTNYIFKNINFTPKNYKIKKTYYNNYLEFLEEIIIKYFKKNNNKIEIFLEKFKNDLLNFIKDIYFNFKENKFNIDNLNKTDINNEKIFYLIEILNIKDLFYNDFKNGIIDFISKEEKYMKNNLKMILFLLQINKLFYKKKIINYSFKNFYEKTIFNNYLYEQIERILLINIGEFKFFNEDIEIFFKIKKLFIKYSDLNIFLKKFSQYVLNYLINKLETENNDFINFFKYLSMIKNNIYNEDNFSFNFLKNLLINEFSQTDKYLKIYSNLIDFYIKNININDLQYLLNFNFLFICNESYISFNKDLMLKRILELDENQLKKEKIFLTNLKELIGHESDDFFEIFNSSYKNDISENNVNNLLVLKNNEIDKKLIVKNIPEELEKDYEYI